MEEGRRRVEVTKQAFDFRGSSTTLFIVHSGFEVFPPKGYGGGERFAYGLAKAASRGCRVVLVDFGKQESFFVESDLEVWRIKNKFYVHSPRHYISYLNALSSMLLLLAFLVSKRGRLRRSLFYFHGGLEYAVFRTLQRLLAPSLCLAYIFRLQSPRWMDLQLLRSWEKFLAIPTEIYGVKTADLVIFESDTVKSTVARFCGPPRDSMVIPNLVDTEFFKESPRAKVQFGILYAAVVKPQKNQLDVVRAIKKVVASEPRASLLLVGDPAVLSYYRSVKDEVARLQLSDHVEFMRSVDILQLNRIRSAYPIQLVYSTYTGFDVAIGETMSLGAACVFSRLPTLEGIVEDEIDCLLVDPQSPDQLADAIIKLLGNPAQVSRLSKAARKTAMEKLSWRTFSAPFLDKLFTLSARRSS